MTQTSMKVVFRKGSACCLLAILVLPTAGVARAACHATDVNGTGNLWASSFEQVPILSNSTPFYYCTTNSPNYVERSSTYAYEGVNSAKFYWNVSGYDTPNQDTREWKGAEACSGFSTYSEGWYGFEFYLPSASYPSDKTATIAQIFQDGSCNSWAAMLVVNDGDLELRYRASCVADGLTDKPTPPAGITVVPIASSVQYDAWKPIVIHWIASNSGTGVLQIWYANQIGSFSTPTVSQTGINFGFGSWSGGVLASGNEEVLKFGQYNWDTTEYGSTDVRVNYFDCVAQLVGSSGGAEASWTTVNPQM
jgi:hypothetical protein